MIFFLILLFMRRGGESSKPKVEAAASVKLSAFASVVPAESVTRLVSTSLEVLSLAWTTSVDGSSSL